MSFNEISNGSREDFFLSLYHHVFPSVCKFLKKKGASMEDVRDLFQEALVIYYEQVVVGRHSVRKDPKSYLFGVVHILWTKNVRSNQKMTLLKSDTLSTYSIPIHDQHSKRILNYLAEAGKKCMDLLKAFYYDQLNMKEISDRFGFSGERSATVQKHKCLQKIRQSVKEKSLQYEDFIQT